MMGVILVWPVFFWSNITVVLIDQEFELQPQAAPNTCLLFIPQYFKSQKGLPWPLDEANTSSHTRGYATSKGLQTIKACLKLTHARQHTVVECLPGVLMAACCADDGQTWKALSTLEWKQVIVPKLKTGCPM